MLLPYGNITHTNTYGVIIFIGWCVTIRAQTVLPYSVWGPIMTPIGFSCAASKRFAVGR